MLLSHVLDMQVRDVWPRGIGGDRMEIGEGDERR